MGRTSVSSPSISESSFGVTVIVIDDAPAAMVAEVQADAYIRAYKATGVQTCALPISPEVSPARLRVNAAVPGPCSEALASLATTVTVGFWGGGIGRAACRERV